MSDRYYSRENLQSRFPETLLLDNGKWTLVISPYGGQILKARHCSSAHDVIFLGKRASAANGQAIRGGVPLCWPWFGASPLPGRPIQGFARTAQWEVQKAGEDFIRMELPSSAVPMELVDFPFELFTELRLTDELEIRLGMKNCGTLPVEISCALHTYFAVSDCEKVTVTGLENALFTVKGGPEQLPENRSLQIDGELCRLYCPQSCPVTIHDPEWKRRITVTKKNSNSTLIWNPGTERCAQIPDLEDEEFHNFLCVECNRAGKDLLTLVPGSVYDISQKIKLLPL